MKSHKVTIKMKDGTAVTLEGYSVEDVRWMMKAMANASPAPQPAEMVSLETAHPAHITRRVGVQPANKLPAIREGDHLEPDMSGGYRIATLADGRTRKVHLQPKGLFPCAYCNAVLTTPSARGGHEKPHFRRGDKPVREIKAMQVKLNPE